MPGLVMSGHERAVPGRVVVNFRDDARLRLRVGQPPSDGRVRDHDVTQIVMHTTKGIPGGRDKRPQVIRPGRGPRIDAGQRVARYWSTSPDHSGAHLVVDFDGTISCLADLLLVEAYHAGGPSNRNSIGIEIYQGSDAELYDDQLEAVADLVDVLTLQFSIQRLIPDRYRGALPRLQQGGADFWGVIGHRDCSDNRGAGDPGDAIFDVLERRGYRRFDLQAKADLAWCKQLQRSLRLPETGRWDRSTVHQLRGLGYQSGLAALPPAELPPAA